MSLLSKGIRYNKTNLLPVCMACEKPIEDDKFIDLTDFDNRYVFHRECVTDCDNAVLHDLWIDELEREFLADTQSYVEEKEEQLKGGFNDF